MNEETIQRAMGDNAVEMANERGWCCGWRLTTLVGAPASGFVAYCVSCGRWALAEVDLYDPDTVPTVHDRIRDMARLLRAKGCVHLETDVIERVALEGMREEARRREEARYRAATAGPVGHLP